MAKKKRRIIILAIVCFVILIGGLVTNHILKSRDKYFALISYKDLMNKIDNKEDFVLVISKTDCSHCLEYKPKVSSVANEYKIMIYYIDIDKLTQKQSAKIKEVFNYSGTPTTIFIIDGTEETAANRIVGEAKREKIVAKLKSNGFIDE